MVEKSKNRSNWILFKANALLKLNMRSEVDDCLKLFHEENFSETEQFWIIKVDLEIAKGSLENSLIACI